MQGQYAVFLLLVVALVVSLSCHEYGHAIVAKWFGDDTAERAGRLTLNPIAHIDPIGLGMVALLGIGYAKPVPTDPRNYRRATADLWVALAGPGMNLLLALVTWNIYAWFWQNGWQNEGALIFFTLLAQINLLLMLFNLIPLGSTGRSLYLASSIAHWFSATLPAPQCPLRHRCFSGSGCPQLGRLTLADRPC